MGCCAVSKASGGLTGVFAIAIGHANAAGQSGVEVVLIYAAAAVLGAVILGVGRALMKLIQSRQADKRADEADDRTLKEFFFGLEKDVRTGTPAREGWTVTVDRCLAALTRGQETTQTMATETRHLVDKILYELTPNGGSNMRGAIDRLDEATSHKEGDPGGPIP